MEHRTQNIENKKRDIRHWRKNAPCSMFYEQCSRGFTMLFAVLIAGVLMAIGVSIFNISLKELRLSSTARDSNLAYYVSDTGRECAIYWDMAAIIAGSKDLQGGNLVGFATSTENPSSAISNISQFSCGSALSDLNITKQTNQAETRFRVQLGGTSNGDSPYCADVSVEKVLDPSVGTFDTTVVSQGHNTCNMTDSVIVERGTEANYSN